MKNCGSAPLHGLTEYLHERQGSVRASASVHQQRAGTSICRTPRTSAARRRRRLRRVRLYDMFLPSSHLRLAPINQSGLQCRGSSICRARRERERERSEDLPGGLYACICVPFPFQPKTPRRGGMPREDDGRGRNGILLRGGGQKLDAAAAACQLGRSLVFVG